MFKNVIFDLDGTLLNTIDDLTDAGNWVCEQNGWPTFTVDAFKQMVGHGIPNLVHDFSPESARTPECLASTLAQFSARYAAHKEDKTAPYEGILEMLAALRQHGIKCTVFSNKADALCRQLMQQCFGELIYASRGQVAGVPVKPDPAGLFSLMELAKLDPAETVFIGDSDVDMLTAQNGKLPAIAVLWGFRTKAQLEEAGATQFAHTPEELVSLILAAEPELANS